MRENIVETLGGFYGQFIVEISNVVFVPGLRPVVVVRPKRLGYYPDLLAKKKTTLKNKKTLCGLLFFPQKNLAHKKTRTLTHTHTRSIIQACRPSSLGEM